MNIKTLEDYKRSLRSLGATVYVMGERVKDVTANPILDPHINCLGTTYELANKLNSQPLLTTISHITGERISRFTHIHQSCDDLVSKIKMMRLLGQETSSCFQRCVGFDALNATYATTYDIDQKCGTEYYQKFKDYLVYIQKENLVVVGGMTDPKGDRSLRPSEQSDADMYVHIVDKKKNGIVVRGAKMHQTGAANSHEILVMPTLALQENERDYAVCFALPLNTPGVTLFFGRQVNDSRRLEGGEVDLGNYKYGIVGGECLVTFENVFVPEERIFMAGEYQFSRDLVNRFAISHRQNYGGCRVGIADVMIGAVALLAELQGIDKFSHIREKLIDLIYLNERLYACSIACSTEGCSTPSEAYFPNAMFANVTKLTASGILYEISKIMHEIAGGFVATTPSEKDFNNTEEARLLNKYFQCKAGVPVKHRLRLGRYIENITSSTPFLEFMHGAGSPQTQRIALLREADMEAKKNLAKKVTGII